MQVFSSRNDRWQTAACVRLNALLPGATSAQITHALSALELTMAIAIWTAVVAELVDALP